MGIGIEQLENKIRESLPIVHLEIQDTSNGCGENYAILVVSEASALHLGDLGMALISR